MKVKIETTQVALVKCADYEQEKVDHAVRQSIDLIGGMERYVKPDDKVLLKVALLVAIEGVYPHPSIVKAVIKLVKEAGGIPIVADTPGVAHQGNKAVTAIVDSGIKTVAEEAGAEAFQFETTGFIEVSVPRGRKLHSIYVAKTALEADVIISLSKLKTHGLTLLTGAVKNMFGTTLPMTRRKAHTLGDIEDFGQALVDIYSMVKPKLAIMDGVIGMEGNGPAHGDLRQIGVILASNDCVALDTVASRIVGLEPMKITTTKAATERGLGNGNMNRIQILGEKVEDVEVTFKRPASWQSRIPPWLLRFMFRHISVWPQVDVDKCLKCGTCKKGCPVGALRLSPYPTIDHEKCIECYCCHELCPEGAIILKRSWLAKMAARRG